MNLLVTGGAGFIGANFISYMVNLHPDYRIVCLDALTYAANTDNLPSDSSLFRFVRGDIRDREAVFNLFAEESFDAVINFAAESHVDRSIEDPGVFISTNISGTQVLLDACRQFGSIRFHQVSTDEVYGDLPLCSEEVFTEESSLRPSSPYSASKAAADLLVLSYNRTYGLPVTISRSSNNYGPFQHSEKLIPLMIKKALRGENLPIYGNGENKRDWLYVSDHCKALDMILHSGKKGEIYNIGSGTERSNLQTVRELLTIMGKDEKLISFVKDRPGHDLRYSISTAKIVSELGWSPGTDFYDGLKATAEWYTKQYETREMK